MQKTLKQAVGIDCGKIELVVSIGLLDDSFQTNIKATSAFSNDEAGFKKLLNWVSKNKTTQVEPHFVVEATGVYHEKLCYFLTSEGYSISVVLPNRAASFMRTLKIKTINDKVSASALVQMGLEKKLDVWQQPDPIFRQLKQLCRERVDLLQDRTSVKNQIHALTSGATYPQTSLTRLQLRLQLIDKQLKEIEQEMKETVEANDELKQRFDNVCTIKGIGLVTAITIVAETDGFSLIRNQRQLVSYAGLDVVKKKSGTTIDLPGRISHKGSTHIRRSLHFPALTAAKFDENMKDVYSRLYLKHNIKMKAAVAVQRKLLILVFTIWRKNEPYNPNYLEQSKKTALTELA